MYPARMARINDHYQKLRAGYLFPEIGRRVAAFSQSNPDAEIIRLGIGDVTLPLAPALVAALLDLLRLLEDAVHRADAL